MAYLLGIDLGTSSVKTLLMDVDGNIISIHQEEYGIDIPKEEYAEQDPDMWWKASVHTIREVLADAKIDPGDIKSIGFSGQMHGMVYNGCNS